MNIFGFLAACKIFYIQLCTNEIQHFIDLKYWYCNFDKKDTSLALRGTEGVKLCKVWLEHTCAGLILYRGGGERLCNEYCEQHLEFHWELRSMFVISRLRRLATQQPLCWRPLGSWWTKYRPLNSSGAWASREERTWGNRIPADQGPQSAKVSGSWASSGQG